MDISVVVPLYNEEDNVAELHRQIVAVCEREGYTYEIIMVDDGSSDGSLAKIRSLNPVRCIRFRRNYGQTAAMDAGFQAAKYDLIVTMDGDLQNDPDDIPKLIAMLESEKLDVVSGWRRKRRDSIPKRFVSRVANLLRKILINDGIHDSGCSLKVYRAECFETLTLYGEMHRFIPALLKIRGFRVGELEVNHRERTAGRTKYTWSRALKGFIDMLSVCFWNKYAVRPLHLLGGIGLLLMFLGSIAGTFTVYEFFRGADLSDTAWPMLSAFSLLMGVQTFISGLLADMVAKSYYATTRDKPYHIADTFDSGTGREGRIEEGDQPAESNAKREAGES